MKIAYILPSFSGDFARPYGGLEAAVLNLVTGILEIEKDATIYLLFPNRNQKIFNLPEGIKVIPVAPRFKKPWTFNYPWIGINKNMEKAVADINPDVIHVHGAPGFYRNFDARKTFLTVHGIPFIDSGFKKRIASKLKSLITKRIFGRDLRKYNNVIFLVSYAYGLLTKNLRKTANIFLIPNSIILNSTPSLGVIENDPVFFFSGVLRPLKNIDSLIVASHYLREEGYRFQLKIAGYFVTSAYEEKIIQMVEKFGLSNNIVFLGNLSSEEIKQVLLTIHINVLPSFQEVCPMSIIEAMAFGKPSIASSVGGIPEIVFNYLNGILIPIGDAKKLANKMKFLIDNPNLYKKMVKQCIRISRTFDHRKIAERTLSAYYPFPENFDRLKDLNNGQK
jgi:glycosyltransferase involved in cell wall biosynthesis